MADMIVQWNECPVCGGEVLEKQIKRFLGNRRIWECQSCHERWSWLEDFKKARNSKISEMGLALVLSGEHQKALEYFDAALEIDSDFAEFWGFKGTLYAVIEKYEDAIRCLDKALEIDPTRPDFWHSKGGLHRNRGEYQKALECFDKSIRIKPTRLNWKDKGYTYYQFKAYKKAVECYDKALKMGPSLSSEAAEIWQDKGEAFKSLNREKDAEKCFRKSEKAKEQLAIESRNQGIDLCKRGMYEDAIASFDAALRINPKDEVAWSNKGAVSSLLGRFEDAVEFSDEALAINPKAEIALNAKGVALIKLGKPKDAIYYLDEILKSNPVDITAWSNKGLASYELGLFEDAIECYDKVLEIDPNAVAACGSKGLAFYELGLFEDAISCYDKVLEINPRDVFAWGNTGIILDKLGRDNDAIICFDKSIEVNIQYERNYDREVPCLKFDGAQNNIDGGIALGKYVDISFEELYRYTPANINDEKAWKEWELKYKGKYVKWTGKLCNVTFIPKKGIFVLGMQMVGEGGQQTGVTLHPISDDGIHITCSEHQVQSDGTTIAVFIAGASTIGLGEKEGTFLIDDETWISVGGKLAFTGILSNFPPFNDDLISVGFNRLLFVNQGKIIEVETEEDNQGE